jgi:hypothetical protein
MGNSFQAGYIIRYLSVFDPKTAIIEDEYIDKDYLIDYSNFYSRSFEKHDRYTTRIHFFRDEFTEKYFLDNFHSNLDFQERLKDNNNYLGFTIIKPIGPQKDIKFVGRTLLRTYDVEADEESRHFLEHNYKASLFGLGLTIKSLPYQNAR